MILIGRLQSPFVRRTAILLDLLELDFEIREFSAINDQDQVRQHSPVGRVPALVSDDGTLIDSTAIALTLLDRHDAQGRLWPKSGDALAEALQIVSLTNAALEKSIAAHYERARRPEEFVYQPWIELCESQSLGGLDALEARMSPDPGGSDRLTYADVTVATGLSFLAKLGAAAFQPDRHPRLEALRARCEALPALRRRLPA
ncbi:MAG: glutathione S-transferase family protein [bacterium]